MKQYEFITSCKLCGESVKIPQEEHLLADDHIHIECEMDREEHKYSSPLDFF
tara:strand:+ start:183 stop:338 length:156 start_codon:yes stop_codon:yes gene_type:complete